MQILHLSISTDRLQSFAITYLCIAFTPGVNRYANSAFTSFAQTYSPVCTNLHHICAEQI